MAKASKSYDVSIKDLLRLRPRDALALIGITDVLDVQPEDAELSTIVSAADKVLRVRTTAGEFLVHFEFQSGYDGQLAERMFWYNAALYHQHRLPVESAVVLLTEKADSPRLSGTLEVMLPTGRPCITFRYEVIRLWQIPVATILGAGVGLLPLAPLCEGLENPESIIARINERFDQELSEEEKGKLLLATCTLMGLRFDAETVFRLIPRGSAMKESTTYQAILQEGVQKGLQEGVQKGLQEGVQKGAQSEARKVLLRLGTKQLGTPNARIRDRLNALADIAAIESLIDRISEVSNWESLLSGPPKPRKKKT